MRKFFIIFFIFVYSFMTATIKNNETAKERPLLEPRPIPNIQIDGELKESISTPPIILAKAEKIFKHGFISNAKDTPSAEIYLGYDSTGLYFFANVDCYLPKTNNKKDASISDCNCIEFFLSSDPNANPNRTDYGAKDFHVGVKAAKDAATWNWQYKAPLVNPEIFYKEKPGGYIMEGRIPWSNFDIGCLCKINGREVGFDMAIDFVANSIFEGKSQIRWFGDESINKNPSKWGRIVY